MVIIRSSFTVSLYFVSGESWLSLVSDVKIHKIYTKKKKGWLGLFQEMSQFHQLRPDYSKIDTYFLIFPLAHKYYWAKLNTVDNTFNKVVLTGQIDKYVDLYTPTYTYLLLILIDELDTLQTITHYNT